jgi:SAM-dependent methyltransferase
MTHTDAIEARVYSNCGNPALLRMIDRPVGSLLDCGCGAGDNARIMSAAGWRVTGLTCSPAEQAIASQYCKAYLTDLNIGIPAQVEETYDLILLSHVLEHLVHAEKLLHDLHGVCTPSTLLAVALPNVLAYPQRLAFLRGRFEYTDQGPMDKTHVRFYTYRSGARLLEKCGFRVLKTSVDGAFPLWKLRKLLPPIFVSSLNRGVCTVFPGLFGFQCLYLASPK